MSVQECPRIRYVEVIPIEEKNEVLFYIRDPLEISPSPIVLTAPQFFILTLLDGTRSISDIRMEFAQRFGGILLPDHQLENFLSELDRMYILDGDTFRKRLEEVQKEFQERPTRQPWHAGQAYSAEPATLHQQLESFFTSSQGAGYPQKIKRSERTNKTQTREVHAILVPHIDLRVGGTCYTYGYRHLLESTQPELVIILGVAHMGSRNLFTATTKDFETPLGTAKTDQEFLERWQNASSVDLTADEWIHRSEHSIEFQLLFLQHLIKKPFKIVPVLCGSLEPFLEEDETALELHPSIKPQLEGLRKAIQEETREIAIILSVDLAHVGPKFGDSSPITISDREEMQAADYELFDVLSRFDRETYRDIMETNLIPRRVDAISAIFTFLHIFDRGEGKLLRYEQNFQEDTQSLVTYASMALSGTL